MKKLLSVAVLSMFAVTGAYAASGSSMTPQQRMKECAPLTKGMTKTQRSDFMSKCLSKKGHAAAMASHAKAGSKAGMKKAAHKHTGKSAK